MTQDRAGSGPVMRRAGTSGDGTKLATTIMSLESILRDLEKGGRIVRDPDWYFVTVFGNPKESDRWGWRIEGHHLSLNLTMENDRVVAATPAFFGANPATVQGGEHKGLRPLANLDDPARELFLSLNDEQRRDAHQTAQFPEIKEGVAQAGVGAPRGLAASQLTDAQHDRLMRLIQASAVRMPADVAEQELATVRKTPCGEIYFAYAGSAESGKPHSYRIQGPRFVIEYLNVQSDSAGNPANHIHSSWRSVAGDFAIKN
jgi:hypothetical protein